MVQLIAFKVVELTVAIVADRVGTHSVRVGGPVDHSADVLQASPLAQVALLDEHGLIQCLQALITVWLHDGGG